MRKYTLLPTLVLAISLLTINCKKDSNSSPNYDGNWTGSTSQGRAISFSVSGGQVTNLSITYNLSGSCSQTGATTNFLSSYTITGNSFSVTGSTGVSGTFSSSTSASGSFSVTMSGTPAGCTSTSSGTWTASK
jgi:hypothetical protein